MAVKRKMAPEVLEMVAARFKLLAEPLRLRILMELDKGEMTVSEVAEAVQATQPNISKHLKMLQEGGLLARRQERNVVYYSIADPSSLDLCDVVCFSIRKRLSMQAGLLGRRRNGRRNKPRRSRSLRVLRG